MKKVLVCMLALFIITGCSNNMICRLSNDSFELVFKNGKIIEYYDSKGNPVDKSVIQEMNTYLKNIDDNYEAKKIIKDLLNSYDGECN